MRFAAAAFLLLVASAHAAFLKTGSLSQPRWHHRATALNDGRVLITGGAFDPADSSSEIYEPASGAFSPVNAMLHSHPGHAATLLADGRVLISGGGFKGGAWGLPDCEIFDPATHGFTAAGNLNFGRLEHTATLLGDGRVLIAGGMTELIGSWSVYKSPLSEAELFDPMTERFTSIPPMTAQRSGHTASLLPNGRVLLAGGNETPTSEIFDAATNTFSAGPAMVVPRKDHSATTLADGRVLIVGGVTIVGLTGYPIEEIEIYDPSLNVFTPGGRIAGGVVSHAATLMSDGRVLIAGGALGSARDSRRAFIFDPVTMRTTEIAPMSSERLWLTATTLSDQSILIVGGYKIEAPYHPIFAERYVASRRRPASR